MRPSERVEHLKEPSFSNSKHSIRWLTSYLFLLKGTILAFDLAVERESREASEEGLDGSVRWPKLQSLETLRLFLTLLWLRESSLLSKHMAGCKMEPAGPVGHNGTAGRNSEMKTETAGSEEREMSD